MSYLDDLTPIERHDATSGTYVSRPAADRDEPGTALITRDEYMADSSNLHGAYYSQFVTEETKRHLLNHISVEELTEALAQDQHLNAIPISRWDNICLIFNTPGDARAFRTGHAASTQWRVRLPFNTAVARDAGETRNNKVSPSTLTCTVKAAARMIVERAAQ